MENGSSYKETMTYDHKITDLIYSIDGLIPKKVCDFFIGIVEKYPEYLGKEESYKFPDNEIKEDNFTCLNLSRLDHSNKDIHQAYKAAQHYLNIMITNYVNHLRTKRICPTYEDRYIKRTDNIRILKYEVGQSIKDHTDIDKGIRASCSLNLNEDYEGGEFRFFNGEIRKSFKTGDAMIFPAEPIWIHGTEPVIKGTRYVINCFLK